jgi:cytochrome c
MFEIIRPKALVTVFLGFVCGSPVLAADEAAAPEMARQQKAAQPPTDDLVLAKNTARNHCGPCHALEKGEPHGQGPNLYGVVGREAGSASGFDYSEGFNKAMKGRVWDAKLLDRWLTDTQSLAPGNRMTYFQDDASKRSRVIRYLESLR